MKVSTRIFFCYFIISAVCLYYPFDWVLDTMRTRYLEGVEDPLVDQANFLATAVELEMERGVFEPEKWHQAFDHVYQRPVQAKIYKLVKDRVDIEIYITDAQGIVVFHSADPEVVGEDYSQWRDVSLTLKGEYGARTTRQVEGDESSSVLHVAAPIILGGNIAGVLTVCKPTTNITWLVKKAKLQVVGIAFLALLVAGLLGFLASRWITLPIKRLTDYANAIRTGKRTAFPELGRSEIGEMGHAFEKMQEALEGKRYVEQYVQNLTHEVKSPLSAIRGAAELLEEPMDEQQRVRFLANIRGESLRIQKIVDKMLDLSSLESRSKLLHIEPVRLLPLIRTVLEGLEPVMTRKKLVSEVLVPEDASVAGDSFLLHQAVTNLIQNAIDFSPMQGKIMVQAESDRQMVRISVIDQGTGIAEFAGERIYEKFFSLQRPDTGQKSTGLGLNFVRQVALLHEGDITLENRAQGGVTAVLSLRQELAQRAGRAEVAGKK
jgi:two-component system sensor histidine kinase CreC